MKKIILLICFLVSFHLYSENRVALVIGNSNYDSKPLKNSLNDAIDMSSTLRGLGFEVILLTDSSRRDILRGIRDFSDKLDKNSVGLFYYAGHGVQINNVNYLVPVNADIIVESDVEFEGVSLDRVIRSMEDAKTYQSLVFLDACRDNPYTSSSRSGSRGLTVVSADTSNISAGALIAFATSPGAVAEDGKGKNGTFTSALLKYVKEPGLEINQVMTKVRADVMKETNGTQKPWTNVSLTENFYFNSDNIPLTKSEIYSDKDDLSYGNIYIVTNPSGAEISINKTSVGFSPILIDKLTLSNEYEITAKLNGMSGQKKIILDSDELVDIEVELNQKMNIEYGTLIIKSSNMDVDIIIDGNSYGQFGNGIVRDLEEGEHIIELIGNNLYGYKTVSITHNTITEENIELYKISLSAIQKIRNNMVLIEGGYFLIGETKLFSKNNRIQLTNFYINKYEMTTNEVVEILNFFLYKDLITLQLDKDVIKFNDKILLKVNNKFSSLVFKDKFYAVKGMENNPVAFITWNGAAFICNLLSYYENLEPVYDLETWSANFENNGYRLPTEAEWEYAARGGTLSQGYEFSGSNSFNDVAKVNVFLKSYQVGDFPPNELGLYNMTGNIAEWCNDWYVYENSNESIYSYSSQNPHGPISGNRKIIRGGSFVNSGIRNVYDRADKEPQKMNNSIGFRVVLNED